MGQSRSNEGGPAHISRTWKLVADPEPPALAASTANPAPYPERIKGKEKKGVTINNEQSGGTWMAHSIVLAF